MGSNKVTIPATAEEWPKGDALIGNVVYKDGLISGFIDTKALIPNDLGETTIPYDYVDITLGSIFEGELIINKGERCKYLNVKYFELPNEYTPLDYLESSGTQNVLLPSPDLRIINEMWHQKVNMQFLSDSPSLIGWIPTSSLYWGLMDGLFSLGNNIGITADEEKHDFQISFSRILSADGSTKGNKVTLTTKGETVQRIGYPSSLPDEWSYGLFAPANNSTGYAGPIKIWSCTCWNDSMRYDLIPALRNTDNKAGLWDKVSGQFFTTAPGTGAFGYRIKATGEEIAPVPMSLRDPYYVAPSGVYARLIAENELEILPDTEETTGNGWEHFSNTTEAYKHFNIVAEIENLN